MTRVLVVEDDPLMAEIMVALCRLVADDATVVHTMHDALHELTVREATVVLLDLALPDSSPEETLATIAQLKHRCGSVIVVTGLEVDGRLLRAAVNAGADDVLAKNDLAFDARLQIGISPDRRPKLTRRVWAAIREVAESVTR